MSVSESIYRLLPIWAQQSIITIYGSLWYYQRYNKYFNKLVQEYKNRDFWSMDEFNAYQRSKLQEMYKIAKKSQYYQNIFRRISFNENEDPFENLEKLPFLSKDVLRKNPRILLTRNPPSSTRIFNSSGTTGSPTEIFYTPEFHALELAIPAVRNLGWANVDFRERRVMFGVRKICSYDQKKPPFWRYSPIENMAYASIYHLSPEFLPYYIRFLNSYSPDMIMGYPSALNTIAQYSLESGDYPKPAKAIFTTSETISENCRNALEEVWKCKVYDRYGAVEGCFFASQCEYGKYHVSPEVGIIEILDLHGNPCKPGELGEVICTGLQNTLQPLIRYRIGDMARWSKIQECNCGRQMPIIEAIEGRYEDICITCDGRQIVRFDTVFKGVNNICEAQVVQEQISLFTIRIVPTENFNDQDKLKIMENMRLHAGDVKVAIRLVDQIERTTSGKFRAVICNLSQDEKDQAMGNKKY